MWVSVALIPTQRSDAYDYDFWVNEKRLTKLNGEVVVEGRKVRASTVRIHAWSAIAEGTFPRKLTSKKASSVIMDTTASNGKHMIIVQRQPARATTCLIAGPAARRLQSRCSAPGAACPPASPSASIYISAVSMLLRRMRHTHL